MLIIIDIDEKLQWVADFRSLMVQLNAFFSNNRMLERRRKEEEDEDPAVLSEEQAARPMRSQPVQAAMRDPRLQELLRCALP